MTNEGNSQLWSTSKHYSNCILNPITVKMNKTNDCGDGLHVCGAGVVILDGIVPHALVFARW